MSEKILRVRKIYRKDKFFLVGELMGEPILSGIKEEEIPAEYLDETRYYISRYIRLLSDVERLSDVYKVISDIDVDMEKFEISIYVAGKFWKSYPASECVVG